MPLRFQILSTRSVLSPALLRQRPLRSEIHTFRQALVELLRHANAEAREEHQKNHIRDFLKEAFYGRQYLVNTKENMDMVIHLGPHAHDPVGVIVEAKRPGNKVEMPTAERPMSKALFELIFYYFEERIRHGNPDLKHLMITNLFDWFVFDANHFDKVIFRNTRLRKLYELCKKDGKDTSFFYEEARKILEETDDLLPCTSFDFKHVEKAIHSQAEASDRQLITLFKLLSPSHLLKQKAAEDSNKLNPLFYKELLYLIGLEEVKEEGRVIIRRRKEDRHPGALIENVITLLEDDPQKLTDLPSYGEHTHDRMFNVAVELTVTWINRVLFLKLLESQLLAYHGGDQGRRFLNFKFIRDYDELYALFHRVLAVKEDERRPEIRERFRHVPYLNSSLFEQSDVERKVMAINALDDHAALPLMSGSILNLPKGTTLNPLEYIFRFLDAYDFSSEGMEDIQEDNRSLINASVLGKVFEKINGYKDGSIYTPGFITEYMCRSAIRRAVTDAFRKAYGWKLQRFEDIANYIEDRRSGDDILAFNDVINGLRICDPAVGSGHFLVSALNELILIKHELGILADPHSGARIRGFRLMIVNDELVITDDANAFVQYRITNGRPQDPRIQQLQQVLFHEKQQLIENCLFGVDINPNSSRICRLRLWIELLKHAYYKEASGYSELETLPNIDINIKTGNSLVNRFPLDADLSQALKSIKYDIAAYRGFVQDYKACRDRETKLGLEAMLDAIKKDFRSEIGKNDRRKKRLEDLLIQIHMMRSQVQVFEPSAEERKKMKNRQKALETEAEEITGILEQIRSSAIYAQAFEWRFEFPELLNDNGDFEGFDVVIGNPPYIRQEALAAFKEYFQQTFSTYAGTADLYVYFVERGMQLLKPGGQFSYILPNKWMRAGYGAPMRKYLGEWHIVRMTDFGDLPVFEEATTYPSILELSHRPAEATFPATTVQTLDFPEGTLAGYLQAHTFTVTRSGLAPGGWTLTDTRTQALLDKLRRNGRPLGEYVKGKIFYGIKTGYNEAFVIDADTRARLIAEDERSADLIKPFLAGRDIKRYRQPVSDKYLILIPKGQTKAWYSSKHPEHSNVEGLGEDVGWRILKEMYPAISGWLQPFAEACKRRQDQGEYWWELRACDYYSEFEKPKIVYQEIMSFQSFSYDINGYFANNKIFFLPGVEMHLLAVLNSDVVWFFLHHTASKLQGGAFAMQSPYVLSVPIPVIPDDKRYKLEEFVKQCFIQHNNSEEQGHIEQNINIIVNDLFKLTEDEIKLME